LHYNLNIYIKSIGSTSKWLQCLWLFNDLNDSGFLMTLMTMAV
jgi:hypothetical protein